MQLYASVFTADLDLLFVCGESKVYTACPHALNSQVSQYISGFSCIDNRPVYHFLAHDSHVNCLATGIGKMLASGSADSSLKRETLYSFGMLHD